MNVLKFFKVIVFIALALIFSLPVITQAKEIKPFDYKAFTSFSFSDKASVKKNIKAAVRFKGISKAKPCKTLSKYSCKKYLTAKNHRRSLTLKYASKYKTKIYASNFVKVHTVTNLSYSLKSVYLEKVEPACVGNKGCKSIIWNLDVEKSYPRHVPHEDSPIETLYQILPVNKKDWIDNFVPNIKLAVVEKERQKLIEEFFSNYN